MRWFWIDRFIEFESGRRARAVKNVSLSEDHLHDHFPGYCIMPNSLIVEGLAQTGGTLVGEYSGFTEKIVLAKVPKVTFHFAAVPGDQLVYTAEVEYIKESGAMVRVTSHVGDRLQAEGEIVFAHLKDDRLDLLFEPRDLVCMIQALRVFEVGRTPDGKKLSIPPRIQKWMSRPQVAPS